ncbi:MAG TPA: hypothetical protein VK474_09025 [Chthoniobacterales bacterium]|nr:hypothetical protein [Chthoniobacterales bacterium]
MALKNLSLTDVHRRSGVGYAQCSQVLNGHLRHASYLARIRQAIKSAPQPEAGAVV